MPRVRLSVLCVLAAAVCGTGCVSHPIGPARTLGKYQGKATTTAKSALSQVETVRLVAGVADRNGTLAAYLSVVVSEAEDALDGLAGTFESIQPPGAEADALRGELSELLSTALDHTAAVRIAARRGTVRGLGPVAEPLGDDADALRHFVEEHGG